MWPFFGNHRSFEHSLGMCTGSHNHQASRFLVHCCKTGKDSQSIRAASYITGRGGGQ